MRAPWNLTVDGEPIFDWWWNTETVRIEYEHAGRHSDLITFATHDDGRLLCSLFERFADCDSCEITNPEDRY